MPRPLLPIVSTASDYLVLHPESDLWRPAILEICREHRLATDPLEHRVDGANVIFFAGQAHVVKLFAPLWHEVHAGERACLVHVAGQLPVATPALLGDGEIEGWPYLVLERLPGVSLASIWTSLAEPDRRRIAGSLGELIGVLHRLPIAGLEALRVDWPSFIADRRAACADQHRRKGASETLLAGIPAALAAAEPLAALRREVLVHADVADVNVLIELRDGVWQLSGLLDFGDSMVGDADYDLVTTAEFLLCGRPALLRAFLLGYGLREEALDDALSARLMALTLLHRFANLPRFVERVGRAAPFATLDELSRFAWRTSG